EALGRAARTVPSATTGTRPGQEPAFRALAPRYDTLLDGRPTLSWTPLPGARKYDVTVEDSEGNYPWAPDPVRAGAHIVYPPDMEPLKPGRYTWNVIASLAGGESESAVSGFTVPSMQEA